MGNFSLIFFQRLKQYDDDEKKRIARNAELSLLSRRLEEKNTALAKENADLVSRACSCGFLLIFTVSSLQQTELDKAKKMKDPLETKCDKLMKKNNVLSAAVRDKDRQLKETTEENSQLVRQTRQYSTESLISALF